MKRLTTLALTCALITAGVTAEAQSRRHSHNQGQNQGQRQARKTRIDMVIALDTSGSMSGLINSARQKLWDIVNEAARARPAPVLRVGLVTFGSQGSSRDGFVVLQSKLTTDLDAIYDKLFSLRTNGGTEYVGRAVYRSVKEMNWHRGRRTLRQIFVAGNESADQDRKVRAATAVRLARKRGIFVNAIYCGPKTAYDAPGWRNVANAGRGVFASIDHNKGTVVVATPYDARLNKLSAKLNRTYVGYGSMGRMAKARQARQDDNARRTHASVGAARAKAKASAVYRADRWDLVDARKAGKLSGIKRQALPAPRRSMSKKQINARLDKLERERAAIKVQIRKLSRKRGAYVVADKKRSGKNEELAFDAAIKRAIRVQAASKNIQLK